MRAINASVMRQVNRTLILNQIRMKPISRAELAEETGLTRASVTQIVEELIGEGLVMEASMVGRTRLGRRSTQLAINPQAGAIFGVNLGRTECSVGAVDMHGRILRQNSELVDGRSPDEVLDAVAATIARQREELGLNDKHILGVGMCAPGPVSAERGAILNPARFEPWHNLPLKRSLQQRTGLTVRLDSAANAQALEQKYFTAAGQNFALIRLDETLSVGVVVRDKLYRGAPGFEVELGQCPAEMRRGQRLDELISPEALLAGTPYRSWTELAEHVGEPAADAAVERLLECLSCTLASVISAYRVHRAVLGGEIGGRLEPILPRLLRDVRTMLPEQLPAEVTLATAETQPIRMAAAAFYDTVFSA